MSTRNDDDRDYDRDSQYYGQYNRRSDSDYGRSFSDRSFGEGSQTRYGSSGGGYGGGYSGRGRESEGYGREGSSGRGGYRGGSSSRGRESERYGGREGGYGSSGSGGGYSGSGRESERYGREGSSRGSEYSGRYSSGRGGDYGESGRENYWGQGWENERDSDTNESRYGSYRGMSSGERGYGEGSSGYGQGSRSYTQRYNYPSGYRSGQSYDEPRRGYDDRGQNQGEDRGWWDRASDEVASWFGDEEAERRRHMDAQREHRGRGPKNYRRSDERIKDDINDRLSDDNFLDASEVEVSVSNAEVTLTGTVNSRNDKRRAEDIAEAVSGVSNVENRLRVQQSGYGSYTRTGSSMGTGSTGTDTGTTGTTGSTGTTGYGTSSGTGSSTGTGTGTGSSSMSGTGSTTGTGTGTDVSGTPGSTTSSAAAGGGKRTGS